MTSSFNFRVFCIQNGWAKNMECLCRNTFGRACKRRKRVGYSERTFGRAIVDQLALVRRAPGPAYVPR
ncbi:hypothetical protein AHF37_05728 [Paragonimus kellicotti]|nr:hypothetical protein AHF37_05728 [Paragonimus kellicotti]